MRRQPEAAAAMGGGGGAAALPVEGSPKKIKFISGTDFLAANGYYNILDLDNTASAADIKRQYRKQALRFHPDKIHELQKIDPDLQQAKVTSYFQWIAAAYEELSDPERKARYDIEGKSHSSLCDFATAQTLFKRHMSDEQFETLAEQFDLMNRLIPCSRSYILFEQNQEGSGSNHCLKDMEINIGQRNPELYKRIPGHGLGIKKLEFFHTTLKDSDKSIVLSAFNLLTAETSSKDTALTSATTGTGLDFSFDDFQKYKSWCYFNYNMNPLLLSGEKFQHFIQCGFTEQDIQASLKESNQLFYKAQQLLFDAGLFDVDKHDFPKFLFTGEVFQVCFKEHTLSGIVEKDNDSLCAVGFRKLSRSTYSIPLADFNILHLENKDGLDAAIEDMKSHDAFKQAMAYIFYFISNFAQDIQCHSDKSDYSKAAKNCMFQYLKLMTEKTGEQSKTEVQYTEVQYINELKPEYKAICLNELITEFRYAFRVMDNSEFGEFCQMAHAIYQVDIDKFCSHPQLLLSLIALNPSNGKLILENNSMIKLKFFNLSSDRIHKKYRSKLKRMQAEVKAANPETAARAARVAAAEEAAAAEREAQARADAEAEAQARADAETAALAEAAAAAAKAPAAPVAVAASAAPAAGSFDLPPEMFAFQEAAQRMSISVSSAHRAMLENFFVKTQSQDSILGQLYKQLSFEGFLLRLATKRYSWVYLDGRVCRLRDGTNEADKDPRVAQEFFRSLQSSSDLTAEYLTSAEFLVSGFVSPSYVSPVNHGGARGKQGRPRQADQNQLEKDIVISYPAGVELRNGYSAGISPDTMGVIVDAARHGSGRAMQALNSNIAALRKDIIATIGEEALNDTLLAVYGSSSDAVSPDAVIDMEKWKHRTKLAIEAQIAAVTSQLESGVADANQRTMTLKGLGLGAFSWMNSGHPNYNAPRKEAYEEAFIEAVKEAIQNTREHWQTKLGRFELINLPSHLAAYTDQRIDFPEGIMIVDAESGDNFDLVMTVDLHPMRKRCDRMVQHSPAHNKKLEKELEGMSLAELAIRRAEHDRQLEGVMTANHVATCACGDTASMMGNEFSYGVGTSSSDDPATFCSLDYSAAMNGLLYYSPTFQEFLKEKMTNPLEARLDLHTCFAEVREARGEDFFYKDREPKVVPKEKSRAEQSPEYANVFGFYRKVLNCFSPKAVEEAAKEQSSGCSIFSRPEAGGGAARAPAAAMGGGGGGRRPNDGRADKEPGLDQPLLPNDDGSKECCCQCLVM